MKWLGKQTELWQIIHLEQTDEYAFFMYDMTRAMCELWKVLRNILEDKDEESR